MTWKDWDCHLVRNALDLQVSRLLRSKQLDKMKELALLEPLFGSVWL